jgi:hypothetical protein
VTQTFPHATFRGDLTLAFCYPQIVLAAPKEKVSICKQAYVSAKDQADLLSTESHWEPFKLSEANQALKESRINKCFCKPELKLLSSKAYEQSSWRPISYWSFSLGVTITSVTGSVNLLPIK